MRDGQPLICRSDPTIDQSRSLICAQTSMVRRAVEIGLASQPTAMAARLRSRASALALREASPRRSNAAFLPAGIAAFTASISAGSVASASAAMEYR